MDSSTREMISRASGWFQICVKQIHGNVALIDLRKGKAKVGSGNIHKDANFAAAQNGMMEDISHDYFGNHQRPNKRDENTGCISGYRADFLNDFHWQSLLIDYRRVFLHGFLAGMSYFRTDRQPEEGAASPGCSVPGMGFAKEFCGSNYLPYTW